MKNRHRHPLPFLVTLAGCVLMLAWVDPLNATEVTRQLTQKGFDIAQLRKSDVPNVKSAYNDLKVIFKSFHATPSFEYTGATSFIQNTTNDYHFIFPHVVKSTLQADILTWRKRE